MCVHLTEEFLEVDPKLIGFFSFHSYFNEQKGAFGKMHFNFAVAFMHAYINSFIHYMRA